MIVCELIGLVLVGKRSYKRFYIAMYAHTLSSVISTALMVTNTSGLLLADQNDKDKIWVNIVLLVISLLCKISTIILIFIFKRRMNLRFKK